MPIPTYGAAPLSQTFLLVRIMQVISMITIVGMTANFVSEIVSAGIEPPKEFVGTLSVVCLHILDFQLQYTNNSDRPALPLSIVLSASPFIGPRQILVFLSCLALILSSSSPLL